MKFYYLLPTFGSHEVPHKIWARLVPPFWLLLDSNRQTSRAYIQMRLIYRLMHKRHTYNYYALLYLKDWSQNFCLSTQKLVLKTLVKIYKISDLTVISQFLDFSILIELNQMSYLKNDKFRLWIRVHSWIRIRNKMKLILWIYVKI